MPSEEIITLVKLEFVNKSLLHLQVKHALDHNIEFIGIPR